MAMACAVFLVARLPGFSLLYGEGRE
jgi:hypothetical protein